MSTYSLRVLVGRSGALVTHPSDRMNLDTFDDGDKRPRTESCATLMQRRQYWRRVLAKVYTFKIPEKHQEFPKAWGC